MGNKIKGGVISRGKRNRARPVSDAGGARKNNGKGTERKKFRQ